MTCQVHPVLVKRVQCTVRSSFKIFLGSIIGLAFSPPVNGPKDPWSGVLSLPGALGGLLETKRFTFSGSSTEGSQKRRTVLQ